MPTELSILEEQTPAVSPGNYSQVTVYMKDTVGAVFLGIFAVIALIGWIRTYRRYRTLAAQLESSQTGNSMDIR